MKGKKEKKVYLALNYIEDFRILVFAVTGCLPVSAFASLIRIPTGITSSATGLKICAIAAGVK